MEEQGLYSLHTHEHQVTFSSWQACMHLFNLDKGGCIQVCRDHLMN